MRAVTEALSTQRALRIASLSLAAAIAVIGHAAATRPAFTVFFDHGGLTTLFITPSRLSGSYHVAEGNQPTERTLGLQLVPEESARLWNRLVVAPPTRPRGWRPVDALGRELYLVVTMGSSASLRGADDIATLRSLLQPMLQRRGLWDDAIFAPSGPSQKAPDDRRLWLDLAGGEWPPDHARELDRDATSGVGLLEITEEPPAAFDPIKPITEWWVLPGHQRPEHPVASVTLRRYRTVTPIGTFLLALDEYAWTRRTSDGLEGPLALFAYDPTRSAPLRLPLPALFDTARASHLLTSRQEQTLAELEHLLIHRGYSRLLGAWSNFCQRPATPDTLLRDRSELAQALTSLIPGLPEPAEFFDREQRQRLRALGHSHELPGRCRWRYHGHTLTVDLRDCPRSQIVSTWNRNLDQQRVGPPRELPRLTTGATDEHHEVDLRLEVEGLDAEAAYRLLLAALLELNLRASP